MRWTTWVIPLIVGVAAAGVNFYVLNQRAPSAKFLKVNKKVTAGNTLTDVDLEPVELSGPSEVLDELGRTAVREADKGLVVGRAANRDLQGNDLVLWRDFVSARGELKEPALPVSLDGLNLPERLIQVEDRVAFVIARRSGTAGGAGDPAFEEVGPFRVLSVGDLTDRRQLDSKERAGGAERVITIQVEYDDRGGLSREIQKLLAARTGDGGDQLAPRLVAVVLKPGSKATPGR